MLSSVYACSPTKTSTTLIIMKSGTRIIFVVHAFIAALLLFGCGQDGNKDELIQWPDGTNNRYDIEAKEGSGHIVLIPDVRFIQTNERFIVGRAYWRYMASKASPHPSTGQIELSSVKFPFPTEFWRTPDGRLLTNEFWFALDKYKNAPKCYLLVTTNATSWVKWCSTNKVSTNLVEVSQFQSSALQSGL